VDDEQLVARHVELAAQLVGLPVDDAEAFVVRVEDGLQELELGLQPRHRHVAPRISGRAATDSGEVGGSRDESLESGLSALGGGRLSA